MKNSYCSYCGAEIYKDDKLFYSCDMLHCSTFCQYKTINKILRIDSKFEYPYFWNNYYLKI